MKKAYQSNKKSKIYKFKFRAALILVLFVAAFIFTFAHFRDNDLADPIILIEYNNAYYELWDKEYLKRIDLYKDITENDLGEKLTIITKDMISAPDENKYIDCSLYEYNPVNSRAVIAVDINGEYELFGFCNFLKGMVKDDVRIDAAKNLEIFNITSPEKIISIEVISPYEKNVIGVTKPKVIKKITDRKFIKNFYDEYKNMKDVGHEFFEKDVFGNITEEDWQGGYNDYLKGERNFRLNLENGLSTELDYYPAVGYLYDRMSDYKLSEEFMSYLNEVCD